MFNLSPTSILVLPLLTLGPLLPVLPISPLITMRIAIGIVVFSIVLVWHSRRAGVDKSLVYTVLFSLSICIVPVIVKGYDPFFLAIILGGWLGFVSLQYFRFAAPLIGVLALLCMYLILYYVRNGNLDEAFYTEIYGEAVGASRNFVGIVLMQYYLIYYSVCTANRIKPHHWPLFAMPVIAIMSGGVASTLVAAALMSGYILLTLKMRPMYGVLSLLFIVSVGLLGSRLIESSLVFDRLMSQQFIGSRELLWSDFFERLDAHSILVGFPKHAGFIDHEVSLNEVENLHNSYLNLYKKVGIFSGLYLWLVGYVAFGLFRINKTLFMIYVASLIRAATDGYYFTSFLVDFIIFYLFMLTPLGEKLMPSLKRLRQKSGVQVYLRTVQ